jgi:bacillopeptidase F (M6 metalloprotease family)
VPGSDFQVPDEPVYEGFQLGWVKEEITLDDYVGGNVNIRFVLASDGFQEYDGFYFDDITITTILPGTNSIDETAEGSILSVTPNPATDYIYVNIQNSSANGKIKVYDTLGKIVYQQNINGSAASVKIPVNDLKQGVYFIRLENNAGNSAPVKMVKN